GIVILAAGLCAIGASGVLSRASVRPWSRIQDSLRTRPKIGEVPSLVKESRYLGPMDSSQTLLMCISFQVNDEADLLQTIEDIYHPESPRFRQWLTPREFGRRFGRPAEEIKQKQDWLIRQGFVINQVWPSNLAITFTGEVSSVQRAL